MNICRYVNNYFKVSGKSGNFKIENHILTGFSPIPALDTYLYIERANASIKGSLINEGMYKVTDGKITLADTKDEEWQGNIFVCAIPSDFLRLVDEITANASAASQAEGNIISEHNASYSYTLALNKDGMPASWRDIYGSRLNHWRLL